MIVIVEILRSIIQLCATFRTNYRGDNVADRARIPIGGLQYIISASNRVVIRGIR